MALTLGNPIIITGEMATSYKTQLAAAVPGGGINNTSYGTLTTLKITKVYWENPGSVGGGVVQSCRRDDAKQSHGALAEWD